MNQERDTRSERRDSEPTSAGNGSHPEPCEPQRLPVARRFEDLIVFNKARPWVKRIYEVSRCHDFGRDYSLRDQVRRAATSVLLNIAEGFERGNRKEFRHFVEIAKASCGEVRAGLLIAYDIGYLSKDVFEALSADGEELGRMLGGLRKALAR